MSDPLEPLFGSPVADWHRWFAWRPVDTVDHGYVWLAHIWRRRIQRHQYLNGGPDFWFQHRASAPKEASDV